MSIVSVKFKKDGKSYYFDDNGISLSKDDYILVETDKGIQLGIVNDIDLNIDRDKIKTEIKKIKKKATKKDYDIYLKNLYGDYMTIPKEEERHIHLEEQEEKR